MFENHPEIQSVDTLEQDFSELTAVISRLDGLRVGLVRSLDGAQVATADGARSLAEWLSGRFDLDAATARDLISLARSDDPEIDAALGEGRVTTDRAVAVNLLRAAGAAQSVIDGSWGHDLAGVRNLASRHRRIDRHHERDEFTGRYLHIQPSLDDTRWKLWGQLTGIDGRILDKAIHTAIDTLPHNPDTTAAQDRADGLVSVASEWLTGEIGGHDLAAEIFIDAQLASVTDGESGATAVGGPRIGPNTLGEILCSGTTAINLVDPGGVVSTSPTSRAIPGPIRGRVLYRDGHRCVVAGCESRSRLQVHHLIAYAAGGTHDPDNLVTVCWYHHHIVIHQMGLKFDPASPPQRRTFLRTTPARAGP